MLEILKARLEEEQENLERIYYDFLRGIRAHYEVEYQRELVNELKEEYELEKEYTLNYLKSLLK